MPQRAAHRWQFRIRHARGNPITKPQTLLICRGMSARPFISYAHEDRNVAMRIRDDLVRLGASPWIDIVDLRAGEEWQPAISAALRQSSHVLILLSEHSVTKRGYAQKEVRQAIEILDEFPPDSIFLIPVRLDQCKPAHSRLKTLHWVDLFDDYADGLRKIAKSLGLSEPTPPSRDDSGPSSANNFIDGPHWGSGGWLPH